MVTADMASGYNREVMAVPGRIGDRNAEGTNRLIRSLKAQIVCCGADVAESLAWEMDEVQISLNRPMEEMEGQTKGSSWPAANPIKPFGTEAVLKQDVRSQSNKQNTSGSSSQKTDEDTTWTPAVSEAAIALWRQMGDDAVELEELSNRIGVSVVQLPVLLLELELAGCIRMLPGNRCMKL